MFYAKIKNFSLIQKNIYEEYTFNSQATICTHTRVCATCFAMHVAPHTHLRGIPAHCRFRQLITLISYLLAYYGAYFEEFPLLPP